MVIYRLRVIKSGALREWRERYVKLFLELNMNTYELHIKKYNNVDTCMDYVSWAYKQLVNGFESESLVILSTCNEMTGYFEAVELFNKSVEENNILAPSLEDCRLYEAFQLVQEILVTRSNLLLRAKDVFRICVELEYLEVLMKWYWISEDMDALEYDSTRVDLSKSDIEKAIVKEAKKTSEELSSILNIAEE